jgi:hypothetical protein
MDPITRSTYGLCHGLSLDAHSGDAAATCFAVDAVAISQQPAGRRIVGECFHDVLRGPGGSGRVDLNHAPSVMGQLLFEGIRDFVRRAATFPEQPQDAAARGIRERPKRLVCRRCSLD